MREVLFLCGCVPQLEQNLNDRTRIPGGILWFGRCLAALAVHLTRFWTKYRWVEFSFTVFSFSLLVCTCNPKPAPPCVYIYAHEHVHTCTTQTHTHTHTHAHTHTHTQHTHTHTHTHTQACLPSWCNRKHDGRVSQRYRFESRRGQWALFSLIPSALSFVFL